MQAEQIVAFAERLAQIAASGGGPEGIAALLADATGSAVSIHETAEPGAAAHAARIAIESAHYGWLAVAENGTGATRPRIDGADVELLARLAAAAIGVELARRPDAARGRRAAFWERLLERRHHDTDAARDDALACGIVLAPAYLAIALESDATADAPEREELSELRGIVVDVFRRGDADVGMLERGATLLAFVPAAREVDASNARTAASLLPKTVAKRASALHFSGGVGVVESPISLARSAEAAQAALAIGRRVYGAGKVVTYDGLGAYPLLYEGADLRRLQSFARGVLAPLRAYDDKHQTELERTLRIFFETGQNVKTAAAGLNVHRHTVFYRLRQIGDICARSLDSPHDQLTLRLAVAIDALHSP